VDWTSHAERLASEVTHAVSRWRPVIAAIPRHLLVPRWWSWSAAGAGFGSDVWELRDGPSNGGGWLRAAYGDRSLVTRVGPLHADHGQRGVLARWLGDQHVTSVDVDAYLTEVAAERLDRIGLRPQVATCNATRPGAWDL
jgi:hypothetical protein